MTGTNEAVRHDAFTGASPVEECEMSLAAAWQGWSECRGADVARPPPAMEWFSAQLGAAPAQPPLPGSPFLWWLQSPGEVMWVPHGYWHATLNLEPTVAFTRNVVPRQSVREVLAALEGVPGQDASARALREVVNERHRE